MSAKHPIIAITGSSGAGTTSVTRTFENIFRRESVSAAIVEGDSFHRHDRAEMKLRSAQSDPSAIDCLIAKYCTRDDIVPRAAEPNQRQGLARLNCEVYRPCAPGAQVLHSKKRQPFRGEFGQVAFDQLPAHDV